ncbi:MAG: iron-containing alcohol dehydrogenase family protein [Anaerolineae bacterium]|jgi:alcohol dehydrogenase class IV
MSPRMYTYRWPVRTYLGIGLLGDLAKIVPPRGDRQRAMIVSADDDWCVPLNSRLRALLRASGYQWVRVFAEVEPNPSWETAGRGAEICREYGIDVVFAVGGGSVLDAAKVIAADASGVDLITVPTTAGTGSELNEWAVMTEPESREKESVRAAMPSAAILDPELTLSLPPKLTLLTGIDAFCHALECYVGTDSNAVSDCLALTAMESVANWLRRAVEYGDDLEARTAMLEASMLAGGAMLGAGLGLMHGLGNVAGGLTHDAHGLILASLLEAVLAFNESAIATAKLARIHHHLGAIRRLIGEKFQELNIPRVRLREDDLALLAGRAYQNVNSRTNPRPFTLEDLMDLARQSFQIVKELP